MFDIECHFANVIMSGMRNRCDLAFVGGLLSERGKELGNGSVGTGASAAGGKQDLHSQSNCYY